MDDAKSKTWYAIALGGAGTYHTVEVPAPLGERENIKPKAIVPNKKIGGRPIACEIYVSDKMQSK
jgi:hypothetical protein